MNSLIINLTHQHWRWQLVLVTPPLINPTEVCKLHYGLDRLHVQSWMENNNSKIDTVLTLIFLKHYSRHNYLSFAQSLACAICATKVNYTIYHLWGYTTWLWLLIHIIIRKYCTNFPPPTNPFLICPNPYSLADIVMVHPFSCLYTRLQEEPRSIYPYLWWKQSYYF